MPANKKRPKSEKSAQGIPAKLTKQQKRDLRRKQLAEDCATGTLLEEHKRGVKRMLTGDVAQNNPNKKSVYKRQTVYPPLYIDDNALKVPSKRFVTQSDECFESILKLGYEGFQFSPESSFTKSFHARFEKAMVGLENEKKYQFDVTQPGGLGTKTAMTYVTRCVVGEPGTTYKYLGLRMFSIPWSPGVIGSSENSIEIGKLNSEMIKHTQSLLSKSGKGETGSCQYNLTLINRCFPTADSTVDLKPEPMFKKDKCTVSWHADSTLEHYSTIGVYHVTRKSTNSVSSSNSDDDSSWRIALRVHHDAEGPNTGKSSSRASEMKNLDPNRVAMPPVQFPFPNKSAYFLLDDFNHHHQHSGDTHRYASTHRVCRTDGHTFQSIKSLCMNALQQRVLYHAKYLRSLFMTSNLVEFEWIRQYYIQGLKHRETHQWWESAIAQLVEYWTELQKKIIQALDVLRDAAGAKHSMLALQTDPASGSTKIKKSYAKQVKRIESVELESYSVVEELLEEKIKKRNDWHKRHTDPIFNKLPKEYRPVTPPLPPYDSRSIETINVYASTISSKKSEGGVASIEVCELIKQSLLQQWKHDFISNK